MIPVSEPTLGSLERKYLNAAYDSGWISSTNGEFLERLPSRLSSSISEGHWSLVSSGTTALFLGLLALEIGAGDEVIVPDLSFVAVPNQVSAVGATPVLVDINRDTLGLDLKLIEEKITKNTKAIIFVHNYGYLSDLKNLREIADRYSLHIIEDLAEAIFEKQSNIPVSEYSDLSIYSFFANKIITSGEGGAVFSKNPKLIERVNFLKSQATIPGRRFEFEEIGFNFRMTNLQAAILTAQIERLEEFTHLRKVAFENYASILSESKVVTVPDFINSNRTSPWLFTISMKSNTSKINRNSIMEFLKIQGIETRPYFQPHSESKRFENISVECPVSTWISSNYFNIPTFSHITTRQIETVCKSILEFENLIT